MIKGGQVEQISLSHAQYKVIECLKKKENKKGLTKEKLESLTCLTFNEALISSLKESTVVVFNEKTSKYSYKFLYVISKSSYFFPFFTHKSNQISWNFFNLKA